MTNVRFILRGINHTGTAFWYTGKAGYQFIDSNFCFAFEFPVREGAERKAETLNRMTKLHGVKFDVVAID